MKLTCIQSRPMPSFDEAIVEAQQLAKLASEDSDMLLLPEYCSGFRVDDGRFAPPSAPEETNPMLDAMAELARSINKWIMLGSIAVPDPATGKIFNRGYVLDNTGSIQSRYNKIHLFDIELSDTEVYRESDIVAPGSTACMVNTPIGMTAHTICYDLRFPQLYRQLAQAGAEILAIPAAFTRTTGKAHWHNLCRTRAIENGAYVVAPCAVGDIQGGGGCYGHSLVVDPWGEILHDGGEEAGIIEVDIDLSLVQKARSRIPSLEHDRPFDLVTGSSVNSGETEEVA